MKNIKYELNGENKEAIVESVEELMKSLPGVAPGTINITGIESVQNNLVQFKTNPMMHMIGLEVQITNLILTFGYNDVKAVLNSKLLPGDSLI